MTESRGWWECGIGAFAEWTFEAGPNTVGVGGDPDPLSDRRA